MTRTQNRPLASGAISIKQALIFATILAVAGCYLLAAFANLLAVTIALLGFVFYVIFYSFSKYHSIYGTLIGSIAGAVPPVVGYCAVRNSLDLGAILFFAIMVLWQMPHFYAIAIYRIKDYAKASIPLLPIIKGVQETKVQMLLYTIAFTFASLLLSVFHYTGFVYLVTAALFGSLWIWLSIQGFKASNDQVWARKMFIFSLVVITALSTAIFVCY